MIVHFGKLIQELGCMDLTSKIMSNMLLLKVFKTHVESETHQEHWDNFYAKEEGNEETR